MKAGKFYLQTAVRHLWRGGSRNLIAFLCVVFGVMSLVSMNTLAQSIQQMLSLKPFELIGGDLTLDRVSENVISAQEEAGLQQAKEAGTISDYTLMDYSTSLAFHLPGSSQLIYPSYGMGVDPAKYPLAGNLTLASAGGQSLGQLLGKAGDIIITKDMALNENLKVGDQVMLSDLDYGNAVPAVITAIASDTPNHQGSKAYYSHQTAQLLMGSERTSNTVLVNSKDPDQAQTLLEEKGWRVFTAQNLANATEASQKTLAMAVNDIGLLGLLVGAIGIANTMQVLLNRRRKEVAIWKTLGYTTRDILNLFVLEAGILGITGSLAGVGLGVLLSKLITSLFSRVTTVLVIPSPSGVVMVSGFVIGTVITVVFALWAIVSTSQISPSSLLRNEEVSRAKLPLGKLVALAIFMAAVFLLVAAWVLKSFVVGIVVLIVSVLMLWVVGLVLLGLMRLVLKIFPMSQMPLAKIARNNLRKRSTSYMMAMIALFIGVVMLTLGAVITESGSNTVASLSALPTAENLAIYVPAGQESAVKEALTSLGIPIDAVNHQVQVTQISFDKPIVNTLSPMVMGRATADAYTLSGDAWDSRPDAAYLPAYIDVAVGDSLKVLTKSGETVSLTVAGTYTPVSDTNWPGSLDRVLVSEETAQLLGEPDSSQFYLTLDTGQFEDQLSQLQAALPQATFISMPDYQEHYLRVYSNLFWFIAVMAGLAVLAGLLLVANSVNLTMLERRFEIGVFKSIGYSQRQVLFTQVLEYGLMSLVVSIFAWFFIWAQVMIAKFALGDLSTLLVVKPQTGAAIVFLTVCLTAMVVVASCWNSTKISPVLTFNDRE